MNFEDKVRYGENINFSGNFERAATATNFPKFPLNFLTV